MDYYQTINAHLLGECIAIKTIKADEASSLPKLVMTKSRQAAPSPGLVKGVNPEEIVAVINIRKCRLVKLTGKVWDQLSSGDDIWMLTAKEWKDHSEKVLVHECKVRHGKILMIRNPSALSPRQVFEMVDAYFPHIEKQFTEITSPSGASPSKPKSAPDAQSTKKPFLKAHTGSPYKPPPPYSEKRRQQLQQQINEHSNAGTPTANVHDDHKPFSSIGKKRSPSPGKAGGERNLAISIREQTVFPPLSPTLLRRVGLVGRFHHQQQQTHQSPLRHYDQFDADGSVLTNDDYYAESDASPGALQSAFDGEASPEQKALESPDAAEGGHDTVAPGAAAVAGAINEEVEGSMVSSASSTSAPPPAPALAPAPTLAPAHVEFDMIAHAFSHSTDYHALPDGPTGTGNIGSAGHDAEEYESSQSDGDDDYQYIRDSGGVNSDLADGVLLGALDDGTLTTVTNSVMDCFSLPDPSISPRSSVHPGYDSHRGSANHTVIEAGLPELAEQEQVDGDHANLPDHASYDLGVAETGTSIGSESEAGAEKLSPSYDDVMAHEFGSESGVEEGEGEGEVPDNHVDGRGDGADSGSVSSAESDPPLPKVPANSYAEGEGEGEGGADHQLSPALSIASPHGDDASESQSEAGSATSAVPPSAQGVDEPVSESSRDGDGSGVESSASAETGAERHTSVSSPARCEPTLTTLENSPTSAVSSGGGDRDAPVNETVPLPSEAVLPSALWHLEPSSASLLEASPDQHALLGPVDAVLGLADAEADVEDRPPLRWQVTEEELDSVQPDTQDQGLAAAALAQVQEVGAKPAQDLLQSHISEGSTPAILLSPGVLPAQGDALHSELPVLSGSFNLGFSAWFALGPAEDSLLTSDFEEGVPPLRWQMTEEEPGSVQSDRQNKESAQTATPVPDEQADSAQDLLQPLISEGSTPAIILTPGILPTEGGAPHSELPTLSGSLNFGSPLGFALGPAQASLGSDFEEGFPPLRWQLTEEEPGSGLFEGVGHYGTTASADVVDQSERVELDLPLPPPNESVESITVLAPGTLPPLIDETHCELPVLTGSFHLGSLGPAFNPIEFPEEGFAPLRWQLTEDEDFAGAVDAPSAPLPQPEALTASEKVLPQGSGATTVDPPAEEGLAESVPGETEGLASPRRSFDMAEQSESSSSTDNSRVVSAAGDDVEVSSSMGSDSPNEMPHADTRAQESVAVEVPPSTATAVLENPMLTTPPKPQALISIDDGHETARAAHYSRLGSACVTGSAQRSRGWPGRGSPRSPVAVGLTGRSIFTESIAGDGADTAQKVPTDPEPAMVDDAVGDSPKQEGAALASVHEQEDEESNELTYSVDRAASAQDERELFPLYTSASIEYTHGTHEIQMEDRERDVLLADEHEGDSGGDHTESVVGVAEDRSVPAGDEPEEKGFEAVRMQVDTSSDLREHCASPPSPILATTSELITLSPHRELESTTRFIRRMTVDSSVEASDSELELHDADSEAMDPVGDEATTDGEGGDASPGTTTSAADGDNDVVEAVDDGGTEEQEEESAGQQAPSSAGDSTAVEKSAGGISVVDTPAPSAAENDPAVNTDATRELEDRVRRQAEELAEASRVKAALEARLDETRKLLQIFAAGRLPTSAGFASLAPGGTSTGLSAAPAVGAAAYSGTDVDIDALENTLKYVSVQPDEGAGDPFPQAAPVQSPDEGHSSSGNTAHMRKSLRRLLERKRDEKLRLAVSESSPDAPCKPAPAPTARSAGSGGTARSPVKAVRTKPRSASGSIGGESSDSAFSGSESRGPGRIAGRALYDATGLPIVGFTIRKEPLKDKSRHVEVAATAATSQQSIVTGIAESVDELDMAVATVGSGSYRLDSGYSSTRATPTVAVVSLELDELLQSNSSDPFASSHEPSPHHGVNLTPTRVKGDDETHGTPFAVPPGGPHVLRPLPDTPAPAPTQTPIAAPIPLLATGSAQVSPRNSASLSAIGATGSAQLSPRNSTSTMSVSLSGAPELPLNLHIKSPRHLAVTLSSSSSASEDEKEDSAAEGSGKLSDEVNLNAGAASPPSTSNFSPASSQGGKPGHFSPRQILAKSSDQRHRSPVLDVIRVSSAASAPGGGGDDGRHAEAGQLAVLDIVSSDGESSVESNNPLLLESTPKIRGFARRPLYGTQHPPGALVAALEEAAKAEGGTLPAAVTVADGAERAEDESMKFFQDSFMVAPSDSGAPVASADSLEQAPAATYLYDYNKYHKLRPELFMDSGPNSPFNPHSLFIHGAAHPTIRDDEDRVGDGVATSGREGDDAGDGGWPLRHRILSETEINTVANASVARLEPSSATKGSSARVSFSPNSEGLVILATDGEGTANEAGTDTAAVEATAASADGLPAAPHGVGSPAEPLSSTSEPARVESNQPEVDVTEQQVQNNVEAGIKWSGDTASAKMDTPERAALHVDVELASDSVPPTPSAAAARINKGDKLAPLLAFSQPFLATQRYLENPSARGQSGGHEILRGIGLRDTIFWCIFQLYGTPDGAMVKGIKMIQVVRALKDAEVCTSITTSQLDLLLTKIHVAAAKGTPVQGNTPTAAVLGSAAGGSRVLRRTASGLNAAAAPVGASVALQSVGTNSSKSEQNSNSLAGAAFPTFCALLSAIAGIVYSADSKIRVRAIKKGVTLGDLSHYYTTPLEEREAANARLEAQWRALLERRDQQDVLRMLQESQISTSGLLMRSVYKRCSALAPVTGSPSPAAMEGGCWSPQLVRTFPEADLDLIRQVWERNSDQIRQIYGFYAMSKDTRRQGSGPSKLLLGFEHCREALVDFQILPHVVDAQGFARLFKVVKLWELHLAEQLFTQGQEPSSAGSGALGDATPIGDGASAVYFATEGGANESLNSSFGTHSSFRGMSVTSPTTGEVSFADGNQSVVAGSSDPLDFKGSVGNLSLSQTGFIELLTRIALGQQKLGVRPHEALENLMHIMDASDGKRKLIRASRKSTSVRHFVYGVK